MSYNRDLFCLKQTSCRSSKEITSADHLHPHFQLIGEEEGGDRDPRSIFAIVRTGSGLTPFGQAYNRERKKQLVIESYLRI